MPWSKSSERNIEAYNEIIKELFTTRRKSLDLVAVEQLVRGNILKYNFTKRQMNILLFIVTFSFNLTKEWAYIPRLSDFEVAGISKFKIKDEINKMMDMNVIEWNQEENLFRVKEPRFWSVPLNMGYKDQRSRELFLLNLEHGGFDTKHVEKKFKEMDNFF